MTDLGTEKDLDRPLIVAAESRTREIAARCRTVERAMRAIGFRAGSTYELLGTLVARLAGTATLRRTAAEIAEAIGCSERQAHRVIDELVRFDVLEADLEPPKPTLQRGRPAKVWLLTLRMDHLRQTLAESDRWDAEHRGEIVTKPVVQTPTNDFRTSDRREVGGESAESRQNTGETSAESRHFDAHTVLALNAIPPSPSAGKAGAAATEREEISNDTTTDDDWSTVIDAVRDAGVERVRQLVDEAQRAGMTAAELAEAAYVVRHSPKLAGGALFDFVRSGGWPTSGVKPAEVIRADRRDAAAKIRRRAIDEAPPDARADMVTVVTVRRLIAKGLAEFVSAEERQTFERFERLRTSASAG